MAIHKRPITDNELGYYLAGLIDGQRSCLIKKKKGKIYESKIHGCFV